MVKVLNQGPALCEYVPPLGRVKHVCPPNTWISFLLVIVSITGLTKALKLWICESLTDDNEILLNSFTAP